MATKQSSNAPKKMRPATSPEGRENQLIALATDLAESRLREGTASAQEIVHFLKMGSPREQAEREKMAYEAELLRARTDAVTSGRDMGELLDRAMKAFRGYSGQPEEGDFDDD